MRDNDSNKQMNHSFRNLLVPILPEFFMEEQLKEEMPTRSDNMTYSSNESSILTTAIAKTEYSITNTTGIGKSYRAALFEEDFNAVCFLETNFTHATEIANIDCAGKHDKKKLAQKNIFLALLLASKPFVQLIANIFVGPLIDKIGYDIPMFFGYIVLTVSSLSK